MAPVLVAMAISRSTPTHIRASLFGMAVVAVACRVHRGRTAHFAASLNQNGLNQ